MNSRELDLDNFTYNRKDRTISSLSKCWYMYHDTLLLRGLYIKHNKKDLWYFGNISNHIDSVFSDSNSTLLSYFTQVTGKLFYQHMALIN
jgi:hypothetical protein